MLDIGAVIFTLYFMILVLLIMALLAKVLPLGGLGKQSAPLPKNHPVRVAKPAAKAVREPPIRESVELKVPVKVKAPKRAPVLEGWKPEKKSKVFDMATPIRMGSVPRPEIGKEEREEFKPLTDEKLAEIAKPKKKKRKK